MRRSREFTSIGLPSFNFIEPRKPPAGKPGRPRPPTHPLQSSASSYRQLPAIGLNGNISLQSIEESHRESSAINVDIILDAVLRDRARQMRDDSVPEEVKMSRLWQSLERFSDAGRFSRDGIASFNPITAALCIQAIGQIVRNASVTLAVTASSPVASVLLGSLGNCVYHQFDPDQPFETQESFAQVVIQQQKRIDQLEQQVASQERELEASKVQVDENLRSVTELFERIIPSERHRAITETLSPFLDPELLIVLWNATATSVAMRKIEQEPTVMRQRAVVSPWEEARKQAARLAASVLQERVKIVISLWETMSREERGQLYKALDPSADAKRSGDSTPSTLKSVLRSLEEVYAAEQIHRRRQLSIGRLGLQAKLDMEPQGILETNNRLGSPTTSEMALRRSTVRLGLRPYARGYTQARGDANAITIPNVLLGAFAPRKDDDGSIQGTESNEQAGEALEPILRVCEDAFDLLCEEPFGNKKKGETSLLNSTSPNEPEGHIVQAKRLLCNLLSAMRSSSEEIMDKFQRSEAARLETLQEAENLLGDQQDSSKDDGFTSLVQTIIHRQRQNPSLLVTAINRSPDILTSAIAQNQGILFFAVTKFAGAVKRFLRLDPKACDHLDALTHKHKGIQLLWNGNTASGGNTTGGAARSMWHDQYQSNDASSAGDNAHLLEWFGAHVSEFATLFLESPDLLKQLFVEMHDREDVTSFYRLMVLLQSTKGVHSFMTRASITALERVAQEDQAAVMHLLRSIFCDDTSSSDKGTKSSHSHLGNKSAFTGALATTVSTAGNRDLLDQLRSSPFLVTCLSEFQTGTLQDVFASHIDLWASYFVDIAATNDSILRQSLATRAESIEGGEMLVKLFDAVMSGSTAMLNLQLLDCAVSGSDAARASEREASMRRKQHQCLYLRGHATLFGAIIGPQIVFASYNPHSSRAVEPSNFKADSEKIEAVTKENAKTSKSTASKGGRGRRANVPTSNVSLSASTKKRAVQPSTAPSQPLAPIGVGEGGSLSTASCSSTESLPQSASYRDKGGFATTIRRLSSQHTLQTVLTVPRGWELFLRIYRQQRHHQQHQSNALSETIVTESEQTVRMSRAQVRTLVLDIWLELLKVDHLQYENASLAALAPFVCDYFIGRYDSLSEVGFWLDALIEALSTYQDDPRLRFFANTCGIFSPSIVAENGDVSFPHEQPGYDNVLYYLHVLAHLFYDHMKIFKSTNHLVETNDGACPISVEAAQLTAATIFGFTLTRAAIETIQRDIGTLPRVQAPAIDSLSSTGSNLVTFVGPTFGFIELDDVMGIFMQQWEKRQEQIDERYKQEFAAHDTGVGRIGLDEFVKIVTTVTCGRVSARECRLVYADVGLEFLDRDAFVRVTRVYQLRLFDTQLPEVVLLENDLLELRQLLGRTNITSTQRELEDLVRYWNDMRRELASQLDSLHQKKATKALLKKQSMLVDRLIVGLQHQISSLSQQQAAISGSVSSTEMRSQLDRAWHEARACVKQLHSAKLTNHYLSGLYIQSSMLKWIRQARRRTHEEERTRTLEALN